MASRLSRSIADSILDVRAADSLRADLWKLKNDEHKRCADLSANAPGAQCTSPSKRPIFTPRSIRQK
jgi:hypothetical protein